MFIKPLFKKTAFKKTAFRKAVQTLLLGSLLSCTISQSLAEELNVYSGRQEALIKPLLDKFTEQTGVKVNLVTGKGDALISRLQSEGALTPADLIIMADAGRLTRANELGLLQSIESDVVKKRVPEAFAADNYNWIALTKRARPIMYLKGAIDPGEIDSLSDLGDDKYQSEICIRSSSNIYNQSMVASLILLQGEEKTLDWAKDLVENFARTPKGGDRDQIKALVAGECKLAVANTYYLGGMLDSPDEETRQIAQQVGVIWPDQDSTGVHINVSGAGITKYAQNKDNAQSLLRFMLEEQSQQWYAEINHEYPVIDGVKWSDELLSFGEFKAQEVDLEKMGELNGDALKLMDKAGWR